MATITIYGYPESFYLRTSVEGTFKNDYLSVSRLKTYEKCPLSFKAHYIDENVPRIKQKEAADKGKLVHEALEHIYKWVDAEEFTGRVPDEVILRIYRGAYERAEGHVAGLMTYEEGLELTRAYFRVHQNVNYLDLLSTEQPFTLSIASDDGEFEFDVEGVIDRIDVVSPKKIRVVDYKTNKMMFTGDQLRTDLQMSCYGLVVEGLFPWAEEVEYAFDMLRHNKRQTTTRTKEQLSMAGDYMIALGRRIESATEFPAVLNPLCPWCDYRESCPDYNSALERGEQSISYKMVTKDNLAEVAAERMRANAAEQILKNRRKEMDKILLARMDKGEGKKSLVAGEWEFIPQQNSRITYPVRKTVKLLADQLGMPEDEILKQISAVANGRLDKLISESSLASHKRRFLKDRLKIIARKTYNAPWLRADKRVKRKG